MKINIFGKKGQNTAEYAIVLALVIAAAIAMQTYVKRGMQGRVHDASDRYINKMTGTTDWDAIGGNKSVTTAFKQYEPEKLSTQSTQTTLEDTETSTMAQGGTVTRESVQKTKQAGETEAGLGKGDYQKYDY